MNRTEFLRYVEDPGAISPEALKDLEEINRLFPWFAGGRILYAKALKNGNDIRFSEALKDAALFSGSRKNLYSLLHAPVQEIGKDSTSTVDEKNEDEIKQNAISIPEVVEVVQSSPFAKEDAAELTSGDQKDNDFIEQIQFSQAPEKTELDLDTDKESSPTETLNELIATESKVEETDDSFNKEALSIDIIEESPLLTASVSEGEKSFLDWMKLVNKESPEKTGIQEVKKETADFKSDSLIEQFIKTEPRIGKPEKTEFFSPVNMARKSLEDREDIVSETLATIFAAQGEVGRAIRIYQKLSLLNPEKSAYFAALIQKLENPNEL